ncbi:flagellar hook-length control protein FliK [Roseivivax sp. CAU 1761]
MLDRVRQSSFAEGRTRIELSSGGLGGIEVDLSADEAGQLRVVLRAENPALLSALRGDRAALLDSLQQGGVDVGASDLDFEGYGPPRERRDGAEWRDGGLPSAEEADDAAPPPQPTGATRRPAAPGRLDILT